MTFDEVDEQGPQSEEHGEEIVKPICDRNLSAAFILPESQLTSSSMPPYPPEAAFWLPGTFDAEESDDEEDEEYEEGPQSREHGEKSVKPIRDPNLSTPIILTPSQMPSSSIPPPLGKKFGFPVSSKIIDTLRYPSSMLPAVNSQLLVPGPVWNADDLGIDLSSKQSSSMRNKDRIGFQFDVSKPTCSINLICHRNGILQKYQIQVISKDRCAGPNQFESLIASNKRLIQTDEQLFKAMKITYKRRMYGIWRNLFSLKTLREIRLVSFNPIDYRPVPTFLPEYVKQDILFAYRQPEKIHSNGEWIQWVFDLRQPGRRYALEFVEGWSSLRILTIVSVLLACSTALGVIWAVVKDDAQTAFTIASFTLGAGSLLLAALATISSIEVSTGDECGQSQRQNTNGYHAPTKERERR